VGELSVRRARREDLPAVVRLLADDPLGSTREEFREPLPEGYYAAFERIDADPRFELVVAELDGEIVGTLQLMFLPHLTHGGGTRAQVEAVRVGARHRSLGLGRRMMLWAIERAREEGCTLMQLTTNAARKDAHRFYERLGFVPSHVGMKLDLRL
jgi:GNAT superfamily N-acetyltransferase